MKISDEMLEKAMDGIVCRELDDDQMRKAIEAVAPMIRAEEREANIACIPKSYDQTDPWTDGFDAACETIAAAIRARKETP